MHATCDELFPGAGLSTHLDRDRGARRNGEISKPRRELRRHRLHPGRSTWRRRQRVRRFASRRAKHQGRMPDDDHVSVVERMALDPASREPGSVLRIEVLEYPGRADTSQPRVLLRQAQIGQLELDDIRASAPVERDLARLGAADLDAIESRQADPRRWARERVGIEPDVERGLFTSRPRARDDRTQCVRHPE